MRSVAWHFVFRRVEILSPSDFNALPAKLFTVAERNVARFHARFFFVTLISHFKVLNVFNDHIWSPTNKEATMQKLKRYANVNYFCDKMQLYGYFMSKVNFSRLLFVIYSERL